MTDVCSKSILKERENDLFRYLDGVLNVSHGKFLNTIRLSLITLHENCGIAELIKN